MKFKNYNIFQNLFIIIYYFVFFLNMFLSIIHYAYLIYRSKFININKIYPKIFKSKILANISKCCK